MNVSEEYDGIIITKDSSGNIVENGVDSRKAIAKESDPRKCFLIAQLHIEYYCDTIIIGYFSNSDKNKNNSFEKFVKSKYMSFNDKIELLKLLKNKDGDLTISKEIINSLIVIAEIRNAFQHSLGRSEAMESLKNNRRKIIIGNNHKKLNQYNNAIDLMSDFKVFFNLLYPKLIALWIKNSFNKEEQNKILRSMINQNKKIESK